MCHGLSTGLEPVSAKSQSAILPLNYDNPMTLFPTIFVPII